MNVPVSVYAEMTPNPTTMKFVANKYLLATGDSVEFVKRQDAVGYSPLAEALFNFPFVKAVFIAANFVTVTKTDNVPWDFITMELREFIRDFIAEGKEVLIQMPVVDAVYDLYEIKQNPICLINENVERVVLNHTVLERKFIASNSKRGMFSLSTEEIAECHRHRHGQYLCFKTQISFFEAYDCATQIFEKLIMKRNVTIDLCAFQIETRRSYVAIAAEKQGYLYTCLSKAIGYTLKCSDHEVRNLQLGAGEKLTHLAVNCSLEAQNFRMDGYYDVSPIRVTEFMHWPSENVTENLLTKLKKELLIKNNGALLHWIDGHEDEGDSKITIGDASWGLVASALLLVTGLIIAFVLHLKKQRKDSLGDQRIALKDRCIERRAKFTRSVSMNDITCPPGVIIV